MLSAPKFQEDEDEEGAHSIEDLGGPEDVKEFFDAKEGSSLRAWLRHFDRNNDQKISFGEFQRGMRKLNFKGDAARIFNAIDVDRSGELCLEEIDGSSAQLWMKF